MMVCDIFPVSLILVLNMLIFLPSTVSSHENEWRNEYPFQNTSLPFSERVDDLVSRLTVSEIILQLSRGGSVYPAPAIPRFGVKPYQWDTECLRGDADAGLATAFPQAIGLAAAFSEKLIHKVAHAVGEEVRAKHIDFMRKHQTGTHTGMSCFSPVINIVRHPLWGRIQETYGEDPFLTGVYATGYVQGLQGSNPHYVRATSGCKHFAVYAGPENIPASRLGFDAKVSERDLRLTHLPAFQTCVEAGTYNIMCSYNSVNGVPACAHKRLLTDILRKEWGFKGYVISDEGAIEFMLIWHTYKKSPTEIVAASLNAGCNLELSPNMKEPFYFKLHDALAKGLVTEATIRESVKPLFYTRMKLGEFDPPHMNPYSSLNMSVVQSPAHRRLALKAALQTFVLLKNQHDILPLKRKFSKIAIVGPMANNTVQMYGDYSPTIDARYAVTPLDALSALGDHSNYAPGCRDNKCIDYKYKEIKNAVQGTQLIIVCLGTGKEIEKEGNDRKDLNLPGKQLQLLQDAVKYGSGIPVILLVFSAGPLDISWADQSSQVSAIVQCFFPAQVTGTALYKMLLNSHGTDSNPSARLPLTWPASMDQVPPMTNYSMEGRTYRYFTGEPLYHFGYGISYSKFFYSDFVIPANVTVGQAVELSVHVQNNGPYDGAEVTQVYISWVNPSAPMPKIQLAGFKRTPLKVKQNIRLKFTIQPKQLAIWSDHKGFIIENGDIVVTVGGYQPGVKRRVSSNVLKKTISLTGPTVSLGPNYKI